MKTKSVARCFFLMAILGLAACQQKNYQPKDSPNLPRPSTTAARGPVPGFSPLQ